MAKKPNIEDAPKWATYLIKDIDSLWWWCENKPTLEDDNIIHSGQMELVEFEKEDDMLKPEKINL